MAKKFKTLYIETEVTDPRSRLRKGLSSNSNDSVGPLVYGDTVNYNIILMTNGAIDTTLSGVDSSTVTASFGDPNTPFVTQTNWYMSGSWGYTGSIHLSSSLLSASLASSTNDYDQMLFEVQTTDTGSGDRSTVLQTTVQIYKEVID